MNRRSFMVGLLAGVAAPMFLPGAGRLWKPREETLTLTARQSTLALAHLTYVCDVAPDCVVAGQLWIKTHNKLPVSLNAYTGTEWIEMSSYAI